MTTTVTTEMVDDGDDDEDKYKVSDNCIDNAKAKDNDKGHGHDNDDICANDSGNHRAGAGAMARARAMTRHTGDARGNDTGNDINTTKVITNTVLAQGSGVPSCVQYVLMPASGKACMNSCESSLWSRGMMLKAWRWTLFPGDAHTDVMWHSLGLSAAMPSCGRRRRTRP